MGNYYMKSKSRYLCVMPHKSILVNTNPFETSISVMTSYIQRIDSPQKCTQDEFLAAYAAAFAAIKRESGIEDVRLMDDTSNPES